MLIFYFLFLFIFIIKRVKASIENPVNEKFRKINTQSRNIRKFPCVEHRNVLCSFMLNVNLSFMVSYWCSGLYLQSAFFLVGWARLSQQVSFLVISICDSNRKVRFIFSGIFAQWPGTVSRWKTRILFTVEGLKHVSLYYEIIWTIRSMHQVA